MKHGVPTRPNRTHLATAADTVLTPPEVARAIVSELSPKGTCLDPAYGRGAFFDALPNPKEWCEITLGKDFFCYQKHVDWIITNPPYSIYDKFLAHCFELADNVALLVPIAKAFKSMRVERLVDAYGGLKLIWLIGGGTRCGFEFGFPTGVLYYQRGYKGAIQRIIKEILNGRITQAYQPSLPTKAKLDEVKRCSYY